MSKQKIKLFLEYIESIETSSLDINEIIKAHKQYEINLNDLTETQILIILANLNDYKPMHPTNNKINIKIIEWEFDNLKLSNIIKREILHNCIITNHLDIVEYLSRRDLHCHDTLINIHFNIFAKVCCDGYLYMAKFLIDYQNKDIDNGSLIHQPYDYNDILINASIKGHLDILIYIIEISNKFHKDYYSFSLKISIIRESLVNNHPNITKWIIETWGIENSSYIISIFPDCIIKNAVESLKYIHKLIKYYKYGSLQYKSSTLKILYVNVKKIFEQFNIKLNLITLQYLFNTFIKKANVYLEKNNHLIIKKIFENIEYTPCEEETKIKLKWLVSLSDKYELTFNECNFAKLTILTPLVIKISNNNIIEACNLLGLKKLQDTEIIDLQDCNICIDKKNHSIITTCNHHFCLNCIYKWIITNQNKYCPYCRGNITLEASKYYIENNA